VSRAFRAAIVCLLCAAPAAAELRRVEAEGLAPAVASETGSGALREAALRAGVSTAVDQVALALLDEAARRPARFGPEELAAVLGDSPSDYAARFKILSDEGLRPAAGERPATYAVRVEVMVEAERVRARLVEAGLLAPETARAPETRQLQVVLEPLASHSALAHARRVLGERGGAKRAVPVELSAGRAVLAVDTPLSPEALADAVAGSDTDGFRIDVVAVDATGVTLHVVAPGATAESETLPAPAPE
jgi:hypothetical protein